MAGVTGQKLLVCAMSFALYALDRHYNARSSSTGQLRALCCFPLLCCAVLCSSSLLLLCC